MMEYRWHQRVNLVDLSNFTLPPGGCAPADDIINLLLANARA